MQQVEGYRFKASDLRVHDRRPGISAFLRTKNGADFVEATIRSHLEFYDEIVAVYNDCSDDTGVILQRLEEEFPNKIKVFHYRDKVAPPGSRAYREEAPDAPGSLVNYSNFALSQTRFQFAVKLDDDHLAIPSEVAPFCSRLRQGLEDPGRMHCFSGLNLVRGQQGKMGIPEFDPVSGNGDIGYFRVGENTMFRFDPRFERFNAGGLKRRFAGYFYWHLKYLKAGSGFANYEIDQNPDSRFARKQERFARSGAMSLAGLRQGISVGAGRRVLGLFRDKEALKNERDKSLAGVFPDADVEAALERLTPDWRELIRSERNLKT